MNETPQVHNPFSTPPRQFGNGTWSCCARTHARPANANLMRVYSILMPHVTEWDEAIDATTEILFGIGPMTDDQKEILAESNAALIKTHKQQSYRK